MVPSPEDSLLNLPALAEQPLQTQPFPYVIVPNMIRAHHLPALRDDFPNIKVGGSIDLESLHYGPSFKQLIEELSGTAFRQAVAKKLAMDLNDRPCLITVRGQSRKKDGRIHADTPSKLVTALLYMNPSWEAQGGRLRLLNKGDDLNDYVAEIPPLEGTLLLFKVTNNGWHGHYPYIGVRKSLQLNYLKDKAASHKNRLRHRLSMLTKKLHVPSL